MEIFPNIHMIEGVIDRRPLQLFLLRGDYRTILIDSGCDPDPERVIFPYLSNIGLTPADIDLVINTHADTDHCGGNSALKRANPRVLHSCGEADREMIEDPEIIWARRYDRYADVYGLVNDKEARAQMMALLGSAQPVDITWTGGEVVRLGPDWFIEIYHTPGHTPGHIIVYDPGQDIVFGGDVVNGAYCPDIDGHPSLCPTYAHVDTYLGSIQFLRALKPAVFCSSHWPVKYGDAVQAFLDESAQFVRSADKAVRAQLAEQPDGIALGELVAAVGPSLGAWPRETDAELKYALAGHLEQLVEKGIVGFEASGYPARFRLI